MSHNHLKKRFTLENQLNSWVEIEDVYSELNEALAIIKRESKSFLENIPYGFKTYTNHGVSHSKAILKNIELLLGESVIQKLSATDTFLIIASAYMHDYGMVLFAENIETVWKSDIFKEYLKNIEENWIDSELRNAAILMQKKISEVKDIKCIHDEALEIKNSVELLVQDYFRKGHNKLSGKRINEFWGEKNSAIRNSVIKLRLTGLLEKICICHTLNQEDVMTLPNAHTGYSGDRIHPRFTAVLLRLGDLLDMDNGRYNADIYKVYPNVPKDSKTQFDKHDSMTMINIENSKIGARLESDNEHVCREAAKWFEYIKIETEFLKKKGNDIIPKDLCLEPIYVEDLSILYKGEEKSYKDLMMNFNISHKKAHEIVQGTYLYDYNTDFIYELISNSMDATKLKLWDDYNKTIALAPIVETNTIKRTPDDFIDFMTNHASDVSRNSQDKDKDAIKWDMSKYSVDIYITQVPAKGRDKDKIILKIKDKGKGISNKDLNNMLNTGHSWHTREDYKETLKEMPKWLIPTGYFGIGLQSVFNVTNEFFIFSKSKNEDIKGISLRNPRMNQHLFVETIDRDHIDNEVMKEESTKDTIETFFAEYDRVGTEIIVEFERDKVDKSFTDKSFMNNKTKRFKGIKEDPFEEEVLWDETVAIIRGIENSIGEKNFIPVNIYTTTSSNNEKITLIKNSSLFILNTKNTNRKYFETIDGKTNTSKWEESKCKKYLYTINEEDFLNIRFWDIDENIELTFEMYAIYKHGKYGFSQGTNSFFYKGKKIDFESEKNNRFGTMIDIDIHNGVAKEYVKYNRKTFNENQTEYILTIIKKYYYNYIYLLFETIKTNKDTLLEYITFNHKEFNESEEIFNYDLVNIINDILLHIAFAHTQFKMLDSFTDEEIIKELTTILDTAVSTCKTETRYHCLKLSSESTKPEFITRSEIITTLFNNNLVSLYSLADSMHFANRISYKHCLGTQHRKSTQTALSKILDTNKILILDENINSKLNYFLDKQFGDQFKTDDIMLLMYHNKIQTISTKCFVTCWGKNVCDYIKLDDSMIDEYLKTPILLPSEYPRAMIPPIDKYKNLIIPETELNRYYKKYLKSELIFKYSAGIMFPMASSQINEIDNFEALEKDENFERIVAKLCSLGKERELVLKEYEKLFEKIQRVKEEIVKEKIIQEEILQEEDKKSLEEPSTKTETIQVDDDEKSK